MSFRKDVPSCSSDKRAVGVVAQVLRRARNSKGFEEPRVVLFLYSTRINLDLNETYCLNDRINRSLKVWIQSSKIQELRWALSFLG